MSTIIFDCEIENAILSRNETKIPAIKYCKGWRDFAGMGISCICAFDYVENRYRVFCKDNVHEFQGLVDARDCVVGFNSAAFDNQLCAAHGITIPESKTYDLLVEAWRADGLAPPFQYPTHAGYGLDAMCAANFGLKKTGNGAVAPVQWQRGNIGSVIDYCLNDVRLTMRLLEKVITCNGNIKHPKESGKALCLRMP